MKPLLLLLFVLGCTKTNELPPEAWGGSDYAAAGITIDRPWAAADYQNALAVLKKDTEGHRDRLPRFGGARSGAVFGTLVAVVPDDPAQPIDQRFIAHGMRFEALKEIAKLYAPNQLATPNREWIELMGACLREASALETESDAFLASFGSDDPKHANRVAGLEQMNEGFHGMILGGLLVADQRLLPEADRIAMLQHVTAALPVLYPHMTAPAQQSIRDTIAKEVTGFPAGPLRDAAEHAQRALP